MAMTTNPQTLRGTQVTRLLGGRFRDRDDLVPFVLSFEEDRTAINVPTPTLTVSGNEVTVEWIATNQTVDIARAPTGERSALVEIIATDVAGSSYIDSSVAVGVWDYRLRRPTGTDGIWGLWATAAVETAQSGYWAGFPDIPFDMTWTLSNLGLVNAPPPYTTRTASNGLGINYVGSFQFADARPNGGIWIRELGTERWIVIIAPNRDGDWGDIPSIGTMMAASSVNLVDVDGNTIFAIEAGASWSELSYAGSSGVFVTGIATSLADLSAITHAIITIS